METDGGNKPLNIVESTNLVLRSLGIHITTPRSRGSIVHARIVFSSNYGVETRVESCSPWTYVLCSRNSPVLYVNFVAAVTGSLRRRASMRFRLLCLALWYRLALSAEEYLCRGQTMGGQDDAAQWLTCSPCVRASQKRDWRLNQSQFPWRRNAL